MFKGKKLARYLNNAVIREEFVAAQLAKVSGRILDAGCGTQQFRKYCSHLEYFGQDFGQFKGDEKTSLPTITEFPYGKLDYVSDIWNIPEKDGYFDAVLCTEVLEHVPYPIETIHELSRLLRPGGTLILTAPSNCLRHMDPFYFYGGFSDRFYERVLPEAGLKIDLIEPVGDYYSWLGVEMARTATSHSLLSKIMLAPAFAYFYLKKKTEVSVNTLCMGYHVVARKV